MNTKYTLEDCKTLAESKGGECLSEKYINGKIKMKWRCNKGHEWGTCFNNIKHLETWCPYCSSFDLGRKQSKSIEDCKLLAKSKGGECLSESYISNKKKLIWKCSKGHVWQATFNKISSVDQWCPSCKAERAKEICLKKYGVPYPMMDPSVALKVAISCSKSIKTHWKTGEKLPCQSSWEAKVVDHLNINQINYQWQPQTFKLPNGKTYRPDLYLEDTDTWVEIKGYFREKSKKKWTMFLTLVEKAELWTKDVLKNMGILVK